MSRLSIAVAAVALAVLALSGVAAASEERPTLREIEGEVMCPVCMTTLDQSHSPIADRMRAFIAQRIAAGQTKSEIKDELVAEFGTAVLAAPPKRGFNLVAWILPLAGAAVGALVLAALAWRWTRRREPLGGAAIASANGDTALGLESPAGVTLEHEALEPELERRVDEELARFEA